ncbi:hypothetical protein [Argonema galeatum]|uniref:hypothetical protein n=1 Tax=Argonema galeatum TaxID=2942762 RepID=UPI00201254D0|nr:hypothetical protein [Argonema galeatum]MCL1465215.1 hypothetical protein [Argonema galeatum A003/A1]
MCFNWFDRFVATVSLSLLLVNQFSLLGYAFTVAFCCSLRLSIEPAPIAPNANRPSIDKCKLCAYPGQVNVTRTGVLSVDVLYVRSDRISVVRRSVAVMLHSPK